MAEEKATIASHPAVRHKPSPNAPGAAAAEPEKDGDPIPRRVWVQNVAVQASAIRTRVAVLRTRHGDDPASVMLAEGVLELIGRASDAAFRRDPIPTRWGIWWRGTLIEAAYQNLHAAEALMVELYDEAEIYAEIPEAVARVEAGLHRDDPRRVSARALLMRASAGDLTHRRERLRKAIEVGYAHADQQHSRLRSFRNQVLGAAFLIAVCVGAFVAIVATHPNWVPLCFTPSPGHLVCPTGGAAPLGSDVVVVALLGLLGGTLAGAVSIRKVRGTSTPYDVPTALAVLKVPFGTMTAIGTLVVIRGDFIPGLSALDSQVQILSYALLFGYAQQLLTGLIDRHAQEILSSIPSKDSTVPRPEVATSVGTEVAP